jgi:medium-chain acyl-[acyl-carrier-protein] hydrolase
MKRMWKDSYRIGSYEVDVKGRLSLPVLCGYLQETAWHHAHNLEVGYDHLLRKNKLWVLSRLIIHIRTFPRWGDAISVNTWAKGLHRLFALRDFEILDRDDTILGTATTSWLIIDVESRRPQRPEPFFHSAPMLTERNALIDDFKKIPTVLSGDALPPYTVRYSDLDIYEHVNNGKYVEWVLNSFDPDRHREEMVDTFKIQFLAESFWGEEVSILFEELPGTPTTVLINAFKTQARDRSAQSEIFRAELGWRREGSA